MMKGVLIWAGRIIALLSVIGLIAGWAVEQDLKSKSGEYQLVKASAEGALFGDAYEKIGTPQTFVILDKTAVIPADGESPQRLNEDVLKEKGIPPLQLKTVSFVAGLTRIGFAVGLILGVLMAVLPGRKKPSPGQKGETLITPQA